MLAIEDGRRPSCTRTHPAWRLTTMTQGNNNDMQTQTSAMESAASHSFPDHVAELEATLPIHEINASVQWVGLHTGAPAVVVRTQGCTVGCKYCDVPEAWHLPSEALRPDWKRKIARWRNLTYQQIFDVARELYKHLRHVVITGGEPAMHAGTGELARKMWAAGYYVQYETSGTYPLPPDLPEKAWVTVSPKFGMLGGRQVLDSVLERANEVVMPLARERDITMLQQRVIPKMRRGVPVYLHPIHGGALSSEALKTAFFLGCRVTTRVHMLTKG